VLFNSVQFLVFFPLVVALYFATPHRFRWVLLLAASYYFYAAWRAEYLLLIMFSTGVDYVCGLRMGALAQQARRKKWLALSIGTNLGLLFAFKYFNFFSATTRRLLNQFNIFYDVPVFDVLLPVGISFYTFQTLSYSIDVYRGRQKPERHLGIFALYVSFFPQLVAGPIERSSRLLPQFFRQNGFDPERVSSGLRLMLWGFFKKVVIADRLAVYVNAVYGNPAAYDGPTIMLATYFFAFQIYCDFSGYSDIAIGTARVMGYDLMQNFRRPYFSRSIAEFWQRWHISLSTWFRDYLYIPLGGNRVDWWRWYLNLLVVFLVSGLWHGAALTFVVWGGLHGLYLVSSLITQDFRDSLWQRIGRIGVRPRTVLVPAGAAVSAGRVSFGVPLLFTGMLRRFRRTGPPAQSGADEEILLPMWAAWLRSVVALAVTFHLVLVAWVFFRAASLSNGMQMLRGALDWSGAGVSSLFEPVGAVRVAIGVAVIAVLLVIHALQSHWEGRTDFASLPLPVRWACYYALLFGILILGEFGATEFIYFQF
jgi:alginate O-acetyltransferase complex protein AlgI